MPAYFYPGPTWDQLVASAPTVALAVMNPASGPGAVVDPLYVGRVADAQAAGIAILGYVHTSYGARSVAEVQAEVDLYYLWYGVDGIFFDEAANDCADQPYYAGLDAYVKGKDPTALVAINPGTTTPECFADAADVILNFEDTYAAYLGWSPAGWESGYPPSRFWHLVHTTAEIDMPAAVALSRQRGAGWVYVTGDGMPNPWDTLPPPEYWSSELAYVRPSEGCRAAVRARLVLGGLDTAEADDRIAFSGRVTLASTPALDPAATGARLLLEDGSGTLSDVTVPAGAYADPPAAGWKTSRNGKAWRYVDRGGGAGGITKLVVKDRSSRTPGLVSFAVKGRAGSWPATPAGLPLRATLSLDATAADGPCALADFSGSAPTCVFRSGDATVKCR